VALFRVEQHPCDLEDHQRHCERRHQQPVGVGLQAPRGQQREDQSDEEEDPPVDRQHPDGVREREVELAEQRLHEEREARRGHQPAAVAVGTPAPCDEPASGEGAADECEDDVQPLDRCLAVEEDGPQGEGLGHDDRDPEHAQQADAGARGSEATRHPRAAGG
jgi:hypothetical protein